MSPHDVAQGVVRMTGSDDGTAVTMVLDLDQSRYEEARSDAARVAAVTARNEAEMVRASFDVLSSTFAFQHHLASNDGSAWRASAKASTASISAHIFGWLSTTRLFLDHSRQLLSREFGKASAEFARFDDATHWAYDHSVSYRFLDQLRNAFQHVGMPPFSITGALVEATGKTELRLVADRDKLLAYHQWKKAVREDLSQMDDVVDVYDLLVGGVVQFEFLAAQVRDVLRAAALEPAGRLLTLLTDTPEPRSDLYLARLRRGAASRADVEQLQMEMTPIDLQAISAVADMPATAGPPRDVLPCIGSLADDAPVLGACGRESSALVSVPHQTGVGLVPVCDLHQRSAAKWAVGHLGAAGLIHPAIADYLVAGLAAAGHDAGPVTSVVGLLGLRRGDGPLPPIGQELTPGGWKVPQHPEVLRRVERAIDAMASWAREGGETGAFFGDIQSMIAQDGSVEPLLTGLVNLSGTLLQMVASLHGRSPESLLGSLGEQIGDVRLFSE
jgi:hypothetical protein